MERSAGQRLGGAFVVGGLIAVFAQVIMMIMGMVLPVADLVPPASLIILGLVGMVLVLTGNYEKLNKVGGFGAGIMFCGLVDAVAGVFVGAAMEAGGDKSAGTKAAIKFAVAILGSLVVVGTILGIVLAHTPGVMASMAPVAAGPGPIIFLYAFLMGGLISIEGEALLTFTPLPLPVVILLNAALGMALAIFGVSTQLEVLTGAGLCATVVDAGAGAVLGGATIVLDGTPARAIILVLVMAIVVCMGIVCGNILVKRTKA
ncbi:MAG: hypothetical protein IKE22_09815 [Atopobiaceae bacterium]|nr:hypothetical protein [Atopobiaceae bacterium]